MTHPSQFAWDSEYRQKGQLFAGVTPGIPVFSPGERVLEVGCGDGKTLASMVARAAPVPQPSIVGMDISTAALTLCRKRFSRANTLQLVHADAARMPFPDGSFDWVLLIHVLDHFLTDGRERVAREAARVVHARGRVLVRTFSCSDFRAGRGEEIEEGTFLRGSGIFTHYFTGEEVRELFSHLRVVSLEEVSWKIRVMGETVTRAEIHAVFQEE
ncbi:MAG: class I SAM-dependent methyltransferase [Methanolinea sp.]|nr:class I SAM-dependent methyltransferase [Methanolinea sp.]